MISIFNEKKRLDWLLKEESDYCYNWIKDVTILAFYYKEQGKEIKEVRDIIITDLGERCKYFNKFNKEHIQLANKKISQGFNNISSLNEIEEVYVNTGILEYINENCDDMYQKKILFTMYIWGAILGSPIVKPESDMKKFIRNSGLEKHADRYGDKVSELLFKGLIRKNDKAKSLSFTKDEAYMFNFALSSGSENIISPLKDESYDKYMRRLSTKREKNDDDYKIPYMGRATEFIERGGKSIERVKKLYLYPEEVKYATNLEGINFDLIEPLEEVVELVGPIEYDTNLCNKMGYTDDLHNPGLFIDKYFNGTIKCDICGKEMANNKENIVIENSKKIHRCRECVSALNKSKKNEESAEIWKKVINKETFDFEYTCPWCGKTVKIKANDELWYNYYIGDTPCPDCCGKFELNGIRANVKLICDCCGDAFIMKATNEDYKATLANKVLPLCRKCKDKIKKKARKANIEDYNKFYLEEKEIAREDEEIRKEAASTKILSSKILDDKLKAMLEELEMED